MRYTIALVTALSIVAACAPAQSVNTTQTVSPKITPESVKLAQEAVSVLVQNDAAVPATVYLLDRGQKTRLGEVNSSSNGRFLIRNFGNEVAFYVTTKWDQSGTTNTIDTQAGDRLYVKIDPNLTSIIAMRR
jgi:hypothetical protein